MQTSKKKFQRNWGTSYPANGIRICVDSIYGNNMSGRFYSKLNSGVKSFASVADLLLSADKLFDLKGYPQNYQEKRTFQEEDIWSGRYSVPEALMNDSDILAQYGNCCTLDIFVQSRHRAGWQGIIVNMNGEAAEYQSELELIEMMLSEISN